MLLLELTFDDPVTNVAYDEALLEQAESNDSHPEVLRLWESPQPLVVLGRSSPYAKEVAQEFCRQQGIGFVRRCSGGQSIVAGPGCLMYAVLLDYRKRPELRMLDVAHQFVMGQMQQALSQVGIETQIEGTSDLTLGGRKVSGNSMRCKRNWMIYHGTMIYQMDLDLIANCLGDPVRQPDYRSGRDHRSFLNQLPVEGSILRQAIARQWQAAPGSVEVLEKDLVEMMESKYLTATWNEKV